MRTRRPTTTLCFLLLQVASTLVAIQPLTAQPAATMPVSNRTVSVARTDWFWSSVPPGQSPMVQDHAQLEWYNRITLEHDLNPALSDMEGGGKTRSTLELNVRPPTGEAEIGPEDWTGLTQGLSSFNLDFTNLEAVEIWLNDFRQDHQSTQVTLRIDLGRVSEDAFWKRDDPPNGILDTEDKNGDGRLDRPDPSDPGYEDTGLDGLANPQEPGYDPVVNPDPNGDDYAFTLTSPNDYSTINHTERNGVVDPSAKPDTEDLNWNGTLDMDEAYFEASVDLAESQYVAIDIARQYPGNPSVDDENGWRLFRIPVSAFQANGNAVWSVIQSMRIWLDGATSPLKLQIGGIELVGIPSSDGRPRIALRQNRPNPFNPRTVIEYYLREPGPVRLEIFDASGHLIRALVNGVQPEGAHSVTWSGTNQRGAPVAAGVYYYRLRASGTVLARRMVLLK